MRISGRHACACVHLHICVHEHVCVCVCVCACAHAHVCVCVCGACSVCCTSIVSSGLPSVWICMGNVGDTDIHIPHDMAVMEMRVCIFITSCHQVTMHGKQNNKLLYLP